MTVNAVIPCGGKGTRTGLEKNKILYPIGNVPLIAATLAPFIANADISRVIVVCGAGDVEEIMGITAALATDKEIVLTLGGSTRARSVANGLACLTDDCDAVVIHDGARPFLNAELLAKVIAAGRSGGAICCTAITDTLKKFVGGTVTSVERKNYLAVQTPQCFSRERICSAYAECENIDGCTDDSEIYARKYDDLSIVDGDPANIKITTAADLTRFIPEGYTVGVGFDTHRLAEGRKLILGGKAIPHDKGLLGHSDADVLVHAVMDALLGACGKRDIGMLFPDSDMRYKDVSSMLLLEEVYRVITADGYSVNNVSAVIMAQKPKLMGHIPDMARNIADCLRISADRVTLSATTTEKIGITGREEGISCEAICSCIRRSK